MREWLRQARTSKGITMKQASERLGISESYYSMIENGDRQRDLDLTLANKLSNLFDVPILQIVENEHITR